MTLTWSWCCPTQREGGKRFDHADDKYKDADDKDDGVKDKDDGDGDLLKV